MIMNTDAELLTVKQAADVLGVDRHLLYKLIRDGQVPVAKISPQVWRIPRRLLIEYVEELAAGEKGTDSHE